MVKVLAPCNSVGAELVKRAVRGHCAGRLVVVARIGQRGGRESSALMGDLAEALNCDRLADGQVAGVQFERCDPG